MNPVDIHFRVVVLLDEPPSRARGKRLFQGLAWHDGEQIELRSDDDDQVLCVIPEGLVRNMLPLTGRLEQWYPGVDFYIVCKPGQLLTPDSV